MIRDCLEVIHTPVKKGGIRFEAWEVDFINRIKFRVYGYVSDAEYDTLLSIWKTRIWQ
jgi:hypothetical protein